MISIKILKWIESYALDEHFHYYTVAWNPEPPESIIYQQSIEPLTCQLRLLHLAVNDGIVVYCDNFEIN